MRTLQTAQFRYAAKAFDPSKPLTEAQIHTLKEVIRLSPSSINFQPWHFLVATGDAAKAKIASACVDHMAYNAAKIQQAPLVIVFCAKTAVGSDDIAKVIAQEDQDGRYQSESAKADRLDLLTNYIDKLNEDTEDATNWLDKQTYIALGQVLLAAADMEIDSVPIEGFDADILDEKFDLRAQGYHSTVIVAFGHRSDDDFNAKLPKSRFAAEELFTEL